MTTDEARRRHLLTELELLDVTLTSEQNTAVDDLAALLTPSADERSQLARLAVADQEAAAALLSVLPSTATVARCLNGNWPSFWTAPQA